MISKISGHIYSSLPTFTDVATSIFCSTVNPQDFCAWLPGSESHVLWEICCWGRGRQKTKLMLILLQTLEPHVFLVSVLGVTSNHIPLKRRCPIKINVNWIRHVYLKYHLVWYLFRLDTYINTQNMSWWHWSRMCSKYNKNLYINSRFNFEIDNYEDLHNIIQFHNNVIWN